MKLRSVIMFSAAALAFAACSNEEEAQTIQGEATVTVNVQDAITRALEKPTTGSNKGTFPVVVNDFVLTLEAGSGQQKIEAKSETGNTYTFENVRNPKSLTVEINGGKADGLALADVVETGLAEPLYATTTTFTQTDETHYTASLTPEHRLARLQFSGIKHVDEDNECVYQSLTFDGLFLNGVQLKEGEGDLKSVSADDYTTANTVWTTVQGWTDAPVFDVVTDGTSFLTNQNGWPAQGGEGEDAYDQCYAYNIFPAGAGEDVTSLPKLTLCFSDAAYKAGHSGLESEYRFATVAKYKVTGDHTGLEGVSEDGTIKTFKAGYIYNITGLDVDDEDLGYTPGGGRNATLVATVEILPWTLVNGTVEWN